MNWDEIVSKVAIGVVGGAATWFLSSIVMLKNTCSKLKKDLDCAFQKIRVLEGAEDESTD